MCGRLQCVVRAAGRLISHETVELMIFGVRGFGPSANPEWLVLWFGLRLYPAEERAT
jgi:hypothetical protein